MFCSKCGKRVMDDMVFCPYCGTKIFVPAQDEEADAGPTAQSALIQEVAEVPAHETVERLPHDFPVDIDEMEALESEAVSLVDEDQEAVSEVADGGDSHDKAADAVVKDDWSSFWDDTSVKNTGNTSREYSSPAMTEDRQPEPAMSSEAKPSGGKQSWGIDMMDKADIPDDIFMDDFDDFDTFENRVEVPRPKRGRGHRLYNEEDDYDDAPGFFMRHIRGIVGLLLLLILIVIVAIYALSTPGQTQLAHINATLPLNPRVYAKLGRESYDAEDYKQAGVYFERALAREPQNYDYAQSAVMAYLADENTDKAVELLKKCISINPQAVEPYLYLLNLYPDENTRPWEITQLIVKGYAQMNDERLNLD